MRAPFVFVEDEGSMMATVPGWPWPLCHVVGHTHAHGLSAVSCVCVCACGQCLHVQLQLFTRLF